MDFWGILSQIHFSVCIIIKPVPVPMVTDNWEDFGFVRRCVDEKIMSSFISCISCLDMFYSCVLCLSRMILKVDKVFFVEPLSTRFSFAR